MLKGKMVEAGYTQRSLAKALNMSKNTLNSRINGKTAFDVDEVQRVCVLLNINSASDKCDIFLS